MINALIVKTYEGIKKVAGRVFEAKKVAGVKIFCTFASAFCKHYLLSN